MKANLSLRSFLVVLAVSLSTFPVLLFGIFEAASSVERATDEGVEGNRRAAVLVANDIRASVDRFRALFEGLAVDIDRKTLRMTDPQAVEKVLAAYPQISGVIILNDRGVSVASYSASRTILVGIDYSDRDQVQRARAAKLTAISGNIGGRAVPGPAIVFSVPLLSDEGLVRGFLNGAVPPSGFPTTYEISQQQFAFLFDAFGRVVSSKNIEAAGVSGDRLEQVAEQVVKLPGGPTAVRSEKSQSDVYVADIHPIGWKVVVGVPHSFITSRARDAVGRAALIAVVCAIIGAVVTSVVAFSTVKVLDNVSQQIQRMSASEPRPIVLPETAGYPQEMRTVIDSFNSLLNRTAQTKHAEFEAISKVADAILIARANGQITYINESGSNLFGNILGRNLKDIIGREAAGAIFQSPQSREWKGDISAQKAGGGSFDGFLSCTPIFDQGKVTAIVAIVHDITRVKGERDAVIQSEKMITLGELVAGTSHELNNPLAIVTGYSDLLLEDGQLSDEQRSKVESIRKNAMRASSIVHSLLAFARKRKPERIRTDVNEVVETAMLLKDYDLRTSGIWFEKQLAPDLRPVFADPDQIQQVLLNVINNAQDAVLASPSQPRIVIRTEASGRSLVMIKVEDFGQGIPKSDLKKVFDPFFTTKPVGKGTGLGLAISYGIIREHGGEIKIQSQPGVGTEVTIELPVYESIPVPVDKLPQAPEAGVSMNILVVDDEAEIVSILKRGLSRDGTAVDAAASAAEALSLASKKKYDFIITDMKMPGGSGVDLYKQLCGIQPIYRERTIFLTGDISNPDTVQFLEEQSLPYFSKPFDISAMDKFLREKKASS